MHVLKDAVDVAGREVRSKLPFLELLDHIIGDGKLSLAAIAVAVQILAGGDFEVGVGDGDEGKDDKNFHSD